MKRFFAKLMGGLVKRAGQKGRPSVGRKPGLVLEELEQRQLLATAVLGTTGTLDIQGTDEQDNVSVGIINTGDQATAKVEVRLDVGRAWESAKTFPLYRPVSQWDGSQWTKDWVQNVL